MELNNYYLATFLEILSNQNLLAKLFLIMSISMFLIFTIVVSRQIIVMNKLVNEINFSPIFKFFAYLSIILSALLLVSVVLKS
ncbi:MAG: hypothetical protein A2857_01035 [Candidatus Levybacteria bacterium RIFCSPHIGHO2_01_FULL_36_15]|nr:MAG: hypothetical protein A2857_01035 [Candidatus Levybacteria bacterium RIFCSPHIGHO2_01_FULL_36_15]OGH38620.1 MAG: hypothetical protein A2905_04385 [Candidatus Levybacteria bacterium RIFCSPLOWO2_01_FULL_36_10]